MSFHFDRQQGLVIVGTEVVGPIGSAVLQFALDTGATSTLVNTGLLVSVGYDPALAPDRVQMTTGSGVEYVPRMAVSRIVALGQSRVGFPVLCHTLPPSAGIDGILGLDFFRGQILTVDFRSGRLTLG